MRFLYYTIIPILLLFMGASCTENIPDCPTKFCILATGWQLLEVYEDDVKLTQDVSKYKMTLTLPDDKIAKGNYDRFNSTGLEDAGAWEIQNADKVLLLKPETSPDEPYIIETLTLRKMVLIINRDDTKTGPKQLKYVFEPF
ncbi:MAG TPA: lipocalin family protein [Cyclobacteriaceae bacterium]